MSALPPKADIHQRSLHVRFVPEAEVTLFDHLVGAAEQGQRSSWCICSNLKSLNARL